MASAMEGLRGIYRPPILQFEPNTDNIKRKLLQKGVNPTPKIIHSLRKKEIQKHNRRQKRLAEKCKNLPPLTESQKQELSEEYHLLTLKREYKKFTTAIETKADEKAGALMVGRPWEGLKGAEFLELTKSNKEYGGDKLNRESLNELKQLFEARKRDELQWVLDDDIAMKEEWFNDENESWDPEKKRRKRSEAEVIQFLVQRLSAREITMKDWKFSRMMKLSGLPFTEGQLLRIVEGLGNRGGWKQALSVVEWIYNDKKRRDYRSRFVYTKLIAVLGKARRPKEALQIFNLMRGDIHVYPDMAAYHSIAVTLGQAGLLKELLNIMECMKQKSKTVRRKNYRNWDPILEPDLVIYNAVLNACVPSKQWKGVSWVFKQMRKSGLKPNGASYGLAMEVMLQSGKFDLVHELFQKMRRKGEPPKALTYKVLLRTFREEGKVNEAVEAVRDMERRGVIGTASVYYELACCLCNYGRWQDAMLEVEKIKKLPYARPLEVTFTGMIMSSMEGGHIDNCVCIFEHMKEHCAPNIGTINAMLKVFGRNDMFFEAKELFEKIKGTKSDYYTSPEGNAHVSIIPDDYTYSTMLEASACALQWEYFEHVYREMTLSGYQLDQNKHALLLVEASKAGKCYLLEHAFDTILETGEIPHPLFFIELIIQAISQHNYERAVILVKTTAYAPFRISEKLWTKRLKENEGRFSHESLEQLLEALHSCDIKSEATVSNLSRSLHFLCGLGTQRNITSTITSGSGNTVNGQGEGFDVSRSANMLNNSGKMLNEGAEPVDDFLVCNEHLESEISYANHDHINTNNSDVVTVYGSGRTNLYSNWQGVTDIMEADNYYDSTEEEIWDSSDESCEEVDEGEAGRPSAHEILEKWKESRKGDEGYFLSHRGCS